MKLGKMALLVLLVMMLAGFFAFDIGRFFSLAYLQNARADFAALYAERPLTTLAAYMLVYTVVFAMAVPVGAVMNMVGGALFGVAVGTVAVSLASTLGATLTFLAVRYLLADVARRHFGARVALVDQGIQRDGAFYLFSLRLIPVLPPALMNVLFGLTRMRTWTFAWVSQLGMLAGVLVFVNAGSQLAQVTSARGILSPRLALSLAALGLFPLLARHLVARVRRARSRPSASLQ